VGYAPSITGYQWPRGGENSPFAAALVHRMMTARLEVNQSFRLVHDEVLAATDKQQVPFTYGQLPAMQFYFKQ
jgi:hypothetical protein